MSFLASSGRSCGCGRNTGFCRSARAAGLRRADHAGAGFGGRAVHLHAVLTRGMRILGISAFYHDSAAALLVDGRIVAAAQEERFTRKKHDARFPVHAIAYCLAEAGFTLGDFDYVVFYEKPFLKFERLLETYVAFAPRGFRSFAMAMPLWIREKLFQKDLLAQGTAEARPRSSTGTSKLLVHRASFEPRGQRVLSLALRRSRGADHRRRRRMGDDLCRDRPRQRLAAHPGELHFPHSLGLLYSAFTYYTGFKVNSGEYKLMGLAPYGEPKYAQAHSRSPDRPEGGRQLPARHELLQLLHRPDHDQRALRRPVRRAGAAPGRIC